MITWNARSRPRFLAVMVTLLLLAWTLSLSGVAQAHGTNDEHSHFRYGHITWVPDSYAPTNRTVHFTFVAGFRRDGYGGSHPDGLAQVGDIINEYIGATNFNYGDGQQTNVLNFRVKAINPAENWLLAVALDPNDPTRTKETLTHTYAGPGPYSARSDTCCRTGFLINNPDGQYTLITTVRPGAGNSSPHSNLPAVITLPRNSSSAMPPQTFNVLGNDVDFDNLRYRLATGAESGTYSPPAGITVNSSTGVVSWQTAGRALGFYTMQVIIEDLDASGAVKTKVPVDFMIHLVPSVGSPPAFVSPTPAQGSTVTFTPGMTQTVEIRATDADAGQAVALNHAGLPAGATFTSTPGNPAVGHLTWTPTAAQAGLSQVVTFYASDNGSPSQQSLRSFTMRVATPTCSPTPGLNWKSPLSASTTHNMPASGTLNIRFEYGSCAGFIHDESVVIMVTDLAHPEYPMAAWVYGWDIVIDDAAHEYRQDFIPMWYGASAGSNLRVDVYLHETLVGQAMVHVTP